MTDRRPILYRLDGHTPVPVSDSELSHGFDDPCGKRVALTRLRERHARTEVSTVFLGVDHQFDPTLPPLLFETMIFGGPNDHERWRYGTWDEAAAGHERIVAALRAGEAVPC